ncbi:hypothetical protein [Paraclostridium sordellii]|uniref:hypothetical protein n=1 Tax=Paraclostridium sordellii TaxID=1505 RepID=UPI0022E5788E|nr:hypothetical protein [Paeniclostridium sordellii]
MSEFLYRPIEQKDIFNATDNIKDIVFKHNTSYGYMDLQINITTTKVNETPFLLLNKDIKSVNINKFNNGNLIVYEDFVNSSNIRYTRALRLSSTEYEIYEIVDGITTKLFPKQPLPKYDDIIFYIDKKYDEKNEWMSHYVKCKNGNISAMNNKIFDIEIAKWNTNDENYDNYILGYGYYQYSPVTSKDFLLGNTQIAYDISDLGGGGQIIDPTKSPKSLTQYRNGVEHRLLTEDMIVDPSKVDTSKAITLHPSAPRVLTEECLSVGYTANTKDNKVHPKVNLIIEIDKTCEGCEKLGRD